MADLYRPNLIEQDGVFYLYYNAKTDPRPKAQGGGWHEQSGVATSRDLKHWTRYAGNPVLRNGGRRCMGHAVCEQPVCGAPQKSWGMYYFGLDSHGKARELLAMGSDPYHFTEWTRS